MKSHELHKWDSDFNLVTFAKLVGFAGGSICISIYLYTSVLSCHGIFSWVGWLAMLPFFWYCIKLDDERTEHKRLKNSDLPYDDRSFGEVDVSKLFPPKRDSIAKKAS